MDIKLFKKTKQNKLYNNTVREIIHYYLELSLHSRTTSNDTDAPEAILHHTSPYFNVDSSLSDFVLKLVFCFSVRNFVLFQ